MAGAFDIERTHPIKHISQGRPVDIFEDRPGLRLVVLLEEVVDACDVRVREECHRAGLAPKAGPS
jgi:hypothetical protein